MNKIYVYTEATPMHSIGQMRPQAQFRASTLVFQSSQGPLGFDSPEGSAVLEGLVGDAVLLEQANSPERGSGGPGLTLKFVRWHASKGVIAIASPSEWLLSELVRTDAADRQRKANVVRMRLGRSTVPIDPGWFDSWIEDEQITEKILARLVANASIVSIWRHGEWGVYGRAYGCEQALPGWVRRMEGQNTSVVMCSSLRELPVW